MKPTVYLTNWSSRTRHGPGRKWTIMARPRAWERGEGVVDDFVPPVGLLLDVKAGRVTEGFYFLELRRLWAREVREYGPDAYTPSHLLARLYRPSPEGYTVAGVADGDSLLCACAVGKPCHRREMVPFLLRAGWRVVLDGEPLSPARVAGSGRGVG